MVENPYAGLLQAFDVVEKSYFKTIDDALAEKAHLSTYVLPHNEVSTHSELSLFTNDAEIFSLFQ